MASASSEPVSTLPPLVVEAQRLMTLSVNKIVASRSRKGGVSLHRNLLVAGVLFRARDALLAAGGKMMSQSPPSTASSGTSPSSEAKQQQQYPDTTSNDTCRSSSIPSSPPSADSPTPTAETCIVSAVAETKPCPHREVPVDSDDNQMDIECVGKENVPPTSTSSPSSTSECSKSSSSETEPMMTCDKAVPSQQGAPVSRKRSHSGSSTSCPIVEKSSRVVSSTEEGRSSSVPVCAGHSSSKNVSSASSSRQSSSSSQSCSSSSLSSRSSASVNNPVVYVNRVDVAFCSTSGIGGGVIGPIRPVFVVQVV